MRYAYASSIQLCARMHKALHVFHCDYAGLKYACQHTEPILPQKMNGIRTTITTLYAFPFAVDVCMHSSGPDDAHTSKACSEVTCTGLTGVRELRLQQY